MVALHTRALTVPAGKPVQLTVWMDAIDSLYTGTNIRSFPHAIAVAYGFNSNGTLDALGSRDLTCCMPSHDATPKKIGILLNNLGTPDATDFWSMRRYLSEFLWDRRVIEVPRPAWFFILNGLILTSRPASKGRDYEKIWNQERDESPLKTTTRAQAERLQASIGAGLLGTSSAEVIVDWGMRYGNPSLESAIGRLTQEGCDRLLLVPLYPQYSAATCATACDKVFEVLASMRRQPVLRVAAPYYDDPPYIEEV